MKILVRDKYGDTIFSRTGDGIADIWLNVRYFFQNIIYWAVKMIRYAPVAWEDKDYDYHYLYKTMHSKIKAMRKHMKSCQFQSANWAKTDKRMKTCELLLERLMKDDYCELLYSKHAEKWGYRIFNSKPIPEHTDYSELIITHEKAKTEKENSKANNEVMQIYRHAEYLKKQDKEYLFYLMSKYIEHWWD